MEWVSTGALQAERTRRLRDACHLAQRVNRKFRPPIRRRSRRLTNHRGWSQAALRKPLPNRRQRHHPGSRLKCHPSNPRKSAAADRKAYARAWWSRHTNGPRTAAPETGPADNTQITAGGASPSITRMALRTHRAAMQLLRVQKRSAPPGQPLFTAAYTDKKASPTVKVRRHVAAARTVIRFTGQRDKVLP